MFSLFDNKPLLDDTSSEWLFNAFGWSLENFGADIFHHDTVLVLPIDEFFPGRADSVHGMASLIFERVKHYAGVGHWPTRLVDHSACAVLEPPRVRIKGALRGPDGVADESVDDAHRIVIPYNPQQVNNPEGMIATFAHILAHYMGQMAKEPPPGGVEYWQHATELLAIYLGFGLMFANSAYTFRGGCGSCYNPRANRDAYLTELEATYALAIFAVLKDIPAADVTGHLKKHLRGAFRRMVREVRGRTTAVARLRTAGNQSLPGESAGAGRSG